MRLLKIGTLNIPRDRWEDALDWFSEIDVFCFDTEIEIRNNQIKYIKYNTHSKVNSFLYRAARHFSNNKKEDVFCKICIFILRLVNRSLLREVKKRRYDYIHSSYNDFDESAFLTLLLDPKNYTRAQKETRLNYSYFEKWAFEKASLIVLNDPLNLELYKEKYGSSVFANKNIKYDLDEDARSKNLAKIIQYDTKLSQRDGRIHAVILAGRVISDPSDSRVGGRLYYIPLIKKLVEKEMVVHLHTGKIVPYKNENPYERLAKCEKNFLIEESLDFSKDTLNAYRILSRYDIGVCHAHIPNTEVTEFDKVNIPHRYYEYHLAHVVPFDIRGGNLLLEKKAERKHALIVDDIEQITLDEVRKIEWDTPSFSDYIHDIYISTIN